MKDISPDNWESMAGFNNVITEIIDRIDLTPIEVVIVLELISERLKRLLEAKKGTG